MMRNTNDRCVSCNLQPPCAATGVVVPAGEAANQPCDSFGAAAQPALAQIQFPIQQYASGFCPCEALQSGTLFPELVG